jgi:transposase
MLQRLEVFRPILEIHDAKIADLTRQLEGAADQELPQGLGRLTSVVINREICDWRRFHNRRQVSAYTGLCPGEHSSGERRAQGHVTKHGNQRLRCMLVELAWRMVRFQPTYPPVLKRINILAKGAAATGGARKKAIVAVARQLAVDLWRINTGQCSATQLGLEVLPEELTQKEPA